MSTQTRSPAGLARRLAAASYDGLLVLALCMLTTLLSIAARGGKPIDPGDPGLQLVLVLTAACFFIGFWVRGGQTLGMRVWQLRVEMHDGRPLSLVTAALRFVVALISLACLGIGFWWQLIDPMDLTWHDRAARTRVVVLPKR